MTYETTNWEAEAVRVAWALGVKDECAFYGTVSGETRFLSVARGGFHNYSKYADGAEFMVQYHQHSRWFVLREANVPDAEVAFIALNWDGSLQNFDVTNNSGKGARLAHCLAHVLFDLDLLTPEIETALEVTISQHEKLEWKLEYESNYGL